MNSAFIFVQVAGLGDRADVRTLHDALHAVSGVKTVHFVAGPIDVIVYVEAADQAALMDVIGQLRGVKGVASTDTRIVLPM
jgi:uncharacterized protein with GYD domain